MDACLSDLATALLDDKRVDVDGFVEAWHAATPGYLITGLGARAADDNVTTMRVPQTPLVSNGDLDPLEELRGGPSCCI